MVTITLTDAQVAALNLALDAFIDCTSNDGHLLESIHNMLPEFIDPDLAIAIHDDVDPAVNSFEHTLVLFRPSEDVD